MPIETPESYIFLFSSHLLTIALANLYVRFAVY